MEINRFKIMAVVLTTWVAIGTITYVIYLIKKRKRVEKNKLRSKRLLKKIEYDRQFY